MIRSRVGVTRLQNGHWKSEKATMFTLAVGATRRPFERHPIPFDSIGRRRGCAILVCGGGLLRRRAVLLRVGAGGVVALLGSAAEDVSPDPDGQNQYQYSSLVHDVSCVSMVPAPGSEGSTPPRRGRVRSRSSRNLELIEPPARSGARRSVERLDDPGR